MKDSIINITETYHENGVLITAFQRTVKRIFDLLVVLLLLPPTFVVMAIIIILIRIDSPGPIFFFQKRLGENRKPFKIYKFRTMVENAESLRHLVETHDEEGNFIHKTPDDPRITRIGRLLRKTHLDELPQLLNILKGDMSLVGPRPEVFDLLKYYEEWQYQRFSVPQGLTGWWQINGNDETPIYMCVEDDLYYIEHYSLWFDLTILVQTIYLVCKRFVKNIFKL